MGDRERLDASPIASETNFLFIFLTSQGKVITSLLLYVLHVVMKTTSPMFCMDVTGTGRADNFIQWDQRWE